MNAKSIIFLVFSLLIAIVDQASKWFVTESLLRTSLSDAPEHTASFIDWLTHAPERLPFVNIAVWPFFNLVMVWNEGVSFGILGQMGDIARPALIIMSLIVAFLFAVWMTRSDNTVQRIGLAMVIGGAIGNVIDRFRFGAVIDFLDFHISGMHWPAFNLADSCIVCGVGLLLVHALFLEKKRTS